MKANATKLSSNPLAATRRLSKRLAPQARIRPRKAARGDHPPVEQATRPAQPSRGKAIVSAMLFK